MAGNKKPKRKGANRPSVVERLHQSEWSKRRQAQEAEATLIRMRNALPLGHEVNAHKIEGVFGSLEKVLAEARDTGEFHVDERGKPCMWDEVGEGWKDLCEAVGNMCWVIALLGQQQKWTDDQPPGLSQLVKRIDYGMPVYARDFAGAFDTIAWMREKVAGVSPNQWSEAFDLACRIEEERRAGEIRRAA
jgi:hypothetical protein